MLNKLKYTILIKYGYPNVHIHLNPCIIYLLLFLPILSHFHTIISHAHTCYIYTRIYICKLYIYLTYVHTLKIMISLIYCTIYYIL